MKRISRNLSAKPRETMRNRSSYMDLEWKILNSKITYISVNFKGNRLESYGMRRHLAL
jgi:hypothetical protein